MDAAEVLARVLRANTRRRTGAPAGADESVLELAFACGEHLAAYGTLAPGGQNHGVLAPCPGRWARGTVGGRRAERAFPVFTFDPEAPPVQVDVLHSPALRAFWPQLDDFEGAGYRRILVPVRLADGALRVANLYEAAAPVP